MNNARSTIETSGRHSAEGDIADWLACVSKRDDRQSDGFRKTLDSLLAR